MRTLDPQTHREMRNWKENFAATRQEITRFTNDARLIACPTEAYALWLAVWIAQGGKVTHHYPYNFSRMKWLTPTINSDVSIPAAYGAEALHLLVIDEVGSVSLKPTSGDNREGWEWGHGVVCRLYRDGIGKLRAWTNEPGGVASYEDVEEYIRLAGRKQLKLNAYAHIEVTKQNGGHALPSAYELGREVVDLINLGVGMVLPLLPEDIRIEVVQTTASPKHFFRSRLTGVSAVVALSILIALLVCLL